MDEKKQDEIRGDLNYLRDDIDDINDKMLELLERRLEVSLAIGRDKEKLGLPVLNRSREEEILNRFAGRSIYPDLAREFFEKLFALSRELQERERQKNR